MDEDDADNCSGPASPVLTPRLSPEVQAEGSQSGARLGQPSQPAQRRGVGRPRLSMRGVAGPHGVAGGTLRGGASSSAGHGTPSVHNWLLEQVELTAEETQVVEKCLSESSNATPTLDALCVLPEDKLGELLTPNKQRGLRALVTAALTDRRRYRVPTPSRSLEWKEDGRRRRRRRGGGGGGGVEVAPRLFKASAVN